MQPTGGLKSLYRPVWDVASTFRASGRFGWPLHFALVIVGATALAPLGRGSVTGKWAARGLLAVAVALQAGEARPLNRLPDRNAFAPLPEDRFASIVGDYDHFVFVPIQLQWICRYDEKKVERVLYEAARYKLGINSGYLPRAPKGARAGCDAHLPPDAPLDPRAIYVVDDDFRDDFTRARRRGTPVICAARDDLYLCVVDRPTRFAEILRTVHP
jgi:hypothetical protein